MTASSVPTGGGVHETAAATVGQRVLCRSGAKGPTQRPGTRQLFGASRTLPAPEPSLGTPQTARGPQKPSAKRTPALQRACSLD